MIKILDKYLFTHVLGGTLLVLFILVSLDAFFLFLDELDDVGRHNYGYLQAFIYVLYSLPGRIYEFTPTALLIGSLVGLGSLSANSEITAMRASGMSRSDFVAAALKIGVIFTAVMFITGEWVTPNSQRSAEEMRAGALSKEFSVNQKGGLWLRVEEKIVFAERVIDQERLKNVKIFSFSSGRLSEMIEAKSAVKTENYWNLMDVDKTIINPEKVNVTHNDSVKWSKLVPEGMLEILRVEPQVMSLKDLLQYTDYLRKNNLDSNTYRFAIWNRFAYPLTILVMMVLALPFLFTHQRSGGVGQRLFLGIVLGTVFFLVNTMFNQVGVVYGIHPAASAFFVPIMTAGIAFYMLRKA